MPRSATAKRSEHSEAIKDRAAVMLMLHGNNAPVCRSLQIPESTLYTWVNHPEWNARVARVRQENVTQLDSRLTTVIDEASESILDRIRNGDERPVAVRDEGGAQSYELVRVKLTARDLAIVLGIAFDKRQLVRGINASASRGPAEDRLETLARALQARQIEGQASVQAEQTVNKATAPAIDAHTDT